MHDDKKIYNSGMILMIFYSCKDRDFSLFCVLVYPHLAQKENSLFVEIFIEHYLLNW